MVTVRHRLLVAAALLVTVAGAAVGTAGAALAQEGGAAESSGGVVGGGVGGYDAWDWLGLGLRLGAVLLVVWGAVTAMRWYLRRVNGADAGGGRQLRLLETRALGPNRALHLVRLGHRAVLLGVTPERVTRLLEIDDPEEVERLSSAVAAEGARPHSLRALVGGLGERIAWPRGGRDRAAALTPQGSQHPRAADRYREARVVEAQRAIARARRGVAR